MPGHASLTPVLDDTNDCEMVLNFYQLFYINLADSRRHARMADVLADEHLL